MKGLSVLLAIMLLVGAHVLSVQLRRARALPAQHPPHPATSHAGLPDGTIRYVTPPGTVLEL